MAPLNWRHHALIQALLSRGPLSEEEFHSMFNDLTGKHPEKYQDLFHGALLAINKELAYVQFELRGCRNQYDGKVYYGLLNNVSDEQSKFGTRYTVPQITFYKAVVESIAQDPTCQGCISSITALYINLDNHVVQVTQTSQDNDSHMLPSFKNFTLSQKEKTLNDLIRDGWLSSIVNGKIGLGIRSFLDLRSWLRSNDYPSCDVCNEPAVKSARCPKDDCGTRIHDYCLKKKFAKRNAPKVCPGCGVEWSHLEFDEEETRVNASVQNGMPSNGSALRSTRLGSCKAETFEKAEAHNKIFSAVPRKPRSVKSEAVHEAITDHQPSQSQRPFEGLRRGRRSLRIK